MKIGSRGEPAVVVQPRFFGQQSGEQKGQPVVERFDRKGDEFHHFGHVDRLPEEGGRELQNLERRAGERGRKDAHRREILAGERVVEAARQFGDEENGLDGRVFLEELGEKAGRVALPFCF